tara:strand:+ start:414 stop:743 length:330 start_codon:yes stop_codon:yes gene_type:complete
LVASGYQKAWEVNRLTIAIDFDDTFTADPKLWSTFIQNATEAGHQVMCVTARRQSAENEDIINSMFDHWQCQMPIIFSNLSSKVDEMERRGLKVDIWIDDAPYALVHGH